MLVCYLCVAAEDHHSSVRSPLGRGLDGSVAVLRPRQPVSVAAQEGLLLAGTLNLHHRLLEHALVWKSERIFTESGRLSVNNVKQLV